MYTIVRSYFGKGAKELFDVVEKNKADVEKLMHSVKGFVSYAIVRSGDGGFAVTVCNDKAGADESVEKGQGLDREERRRNWRSPPHDIGGTKHPRFEKRAVNAALVSPIRWA